MSAINLSGNASGSGTYTIASPNSNTSYTLALPEEAGTITTSNSPYSTFRNRIINGDMRIAQRGTSITGLQNSPSYLVDRFSYRRTGTWTTATYTYSQIGSISLAGFENAARLTVTATETPSGDMFSSLDQWIEGFNVADLGFGTASAKTITVSFWVRSSVTGTFSVTVGNLGTRSYVTEYSISAANTWEFKTVTISGDTSGTWLTTNGLGLGLSFAIASSSTGTLATSTLNQWQAADKRASTNQTNLSVTNGATWDITGVQLEVGSVATPFERRPYGTELSLCQRYYEKNNAGTTNGAFVMGYSTANNAANYVWFYKVTKRAAATISVSGATHFWGQTGAGSNVSTTSLGGQLSGINQTSLSAGFGGTSFTIGQGSQLVDNNSGNSWIAASAEL